MNVSVTFVVAPAWPFPAFCCTATRSAIAAGDTLAMVTLAGAPGSAASPTLSQSRIVTEWIVTVPVPAVALLPRWSVNNVPPGAVAPHGSPRIAQSTG